MERMWYQERKCFKEEGLINYISCSDNSGKIKSVNRTMDLARENTVDTDNPIAHDHAR